MVLFQVKFLFVHWILLEIVYGPDGVSRIYLIDIYFSMYVNLCGKKLIISFPMEYSFANSTCMLLEKAYNIISNSYIVILCDTFPI